MGTETHWVGCKITQARTSALVTRLCHNCFVRARLSSRSPFRRLKQISTAWSWCKRTTCALELWLVNCATKSFRLWSDGHDTPSCMRKVRHLETPTLWVQTQIKDKQFVVNKVLGMLSMSVICTKHVGFNTMTMLLDMVGIRLTSEKHAFALVSQFGRTA